MVKYGRGFIPSTLGFTLANCVFSTTDLYLMDQTLRIYSLALLHFDNSRRFVVSVDLHCIIILEYNDCMLMDLVIVGKYFNIVLHE